MSRAIVHKTKGKLDLRALTVFGMNVKPETHTPIGYFGTGLKYAVAVLVRHKIPVTFWISGKKWTIQELASTFRGKEFGTLALKSYGAMGLKKAVALPFTTELGKNWELWQAFRELEANTRDEKGMTFPAHIEKDGNAYVTSGMESELQTQDKGFTCIVVEDERYVQCFLDRDKTFLPDGLSVRSETDRVQAFARKSQHIYYRGIRIMDLEEPSVNTYNILAPLDLTEDRTAKSKFYVDYEIEQFLAQTNSREIIQRAVTSPPKTYEHTLDYQYTSPASTFLDTVRESGDRATSLSRGAWRRSNPVPTEEKTYSNWVRALISAVERGDYDDVERVIGQNKDECLRLLRVEANNRDNAKTDNSADRGIASVGLSQPMPPQAHTGSYAPDDDIPF